MTALSIVEASKKSGLEVIGTFRLVKVPLAAQTLIIILAPLACLCTNYKDIW